MGMIKSKKHMEWGWWFMLDEAVSQWFVRNIFTVSDTSLRTQGNESAFLSNYNYVKTSNKNSNESLVTFTATSKVHYSSLHWQEMT